jgi:hypothetical protein
MFRYMIVKTNTFLFKSSSFCLTNKANISIIEIFSCLFKKKKNIEKKITNLLKKIPSLFLASLNSANVSMIIPKIMFIQTTLIKMKKVTS